MAVLKHIRSKAPRLQAIRRKLAAAACACAAVAGAAVSTGLAQDSAARRADQLKAAYLFNFVKFVEWPADIAADSLTVCFVGGESVYDVLAAGIENKRVGSRRLAVRKLPADGSAAGCNVLYLDAAAPGRPPTAGAPSMLTVSDARNFIRNGGMIEIFTESNRLRFSVNIDNANKAGLRISSSLLQLAAAIEKGASR